MEKQFLNVNRVLNVDNLEASEEGVFLNEEQLEAIDNQIAQIATLEGDVANEKQNVITAQTERDTARTDLTNAISSFDAIDPTIKAAETPEAKVQAIRTLLAAKPGAAPAGNLDKKDPVNSGVDWEAIDNLPHNREADKNL